MYNKIKGYMTNNVIGNAVSLILAIVFFLFISNFQLVKQNFDGFIKIISPFILGYGIAYILNSPINWFDNTIFKKLNKKYSKGLSILSTYITFFVLVFAIAFAILPQTTETLMTILESVPSFVETMTKTITDFLNNHDFDQAIVGEFHALLQSVSQIITNFAINLVSQILTASISFGTILINIITALIASIYMQLSKEKLIFQIKKLIYAIFDVKFADRLLVIGNRTNKIFTGFLVGKMIDSVIIALITFIFMLFLYPPFAVLIAVIIGITNMIPFFGPFIGAIPCAFILLMVSPMSTLIFIGFIIILQQVDGNIIGPKILGDSTGLSAFWVLVSIIVGNGLFGLIGMLIGVPTFAVLYSILSELVRDKLKVRNIEVDNENNIIDSEKARKKDYRL